MPTGPLNLALTQKGFTNEIYSFDYIVGCMVSYS